MVCIWHILIEERLEEKVELLTVELTFYEDSENV